MLQLVLVARAQSDQLGVDPVNRGSARPGARLGHGQRRDRGFAASAVGRAGSRRLRVSPRVAANRSRSAWACSTMSSSASVRHHRCAAVWLTFSTTPLRRPARRWADRQLHAGERRRHRAGGWVADGRHPVEAPRRADAAFAAGDPVERVDQMRLVSAGNTCAVCQLAEDSRRRRAVSRRAFAKTLSRSLSSSRSIAEDSSAACWAARRLSR